MTKEIAANTAETAAAQETAIEETVKYTYRVTRKRAKSDRKHLGAS